MSATPLYNEFPSFLKRYFPYKVQKISLNAGFTCPNRDGSKGYGGCTYCNNQTFNPDYCRPEKPIALQLEEGKRFFAHKYPEMKYLAYFQAYTNTYGALESLKRKYEEALAVDGVVLTYWLGFLSVHVPTACPMICCGIWKISTSILTFWWNTVLRVLATRHSAALTAGILFKLPSMRWSVRLLAEY